MSQAIAQFVAGNREELAGPLTPYVQGSKRNLIASLLILMMTCILAHRMPPFPISLLFD